MAHSLHIYIHMAGVRFDLLRHEMNEGMEDWQVRKSDDRFVRAGGEMEKGGWGKREKGRERGRRGGERAERVHKRGSRAE
jgi:hypothetical protein